jgi:2,5-diamino-6-(ribosylamino)-4(3H)-pyrimidinone 5'-phosphate reductase
MKRPYTFLNAAVTADGKTDSYERRGAGISTPRDRDRVDRLRAEADAVLVGGRTLLGDDPRLTVLSAELRRARLERSLSPNPAKVGVVTRADLKPDSAFLNAGPARIFLFTTPRTPAAQLDMLRSRGVDVHLLGKERVDLPAALQVLHEEGVRRLMVEGGGTLAFELLRLGLVDDLFVFIAPLVFGGEGAPSLAAGPGLPARAALHLDLVKVETWDDGGVLLHYSIPTRR